MTTLIVFLSFFVITTLGRPIGGMLARFKNIANYDIRLWWITPYREEELRFFGHLVKNGGMTAFTCNPGHQFLWAKAGKEQIKSQRSDPFTIQKDKILYLYIDENNPANDQTVSSTNEELEFLSSYYSTYNRHWLSTYNRPPPTVPFLKMNKMNLVIESNAYFWKCNPKKSESENRLINQSPTIANRLRGIFSGKQVSLCQDNNNGNLLKFEIKKLHDKDPQIYKVSSFINKYEADHIIKLSSPSMHRSTTGNGKNAKADQTRTSSNTWLAMNHSLIIETIYQRIGAILGIDSYKMTADATLNNNGGVASHVEVIHFDTGQQYTRHYDNAPGNDNYLHFITFQVILKVNDNFSGGDTMFPLSDQNNGYSVGSEEYSAVFWYNLLNDGNLDEYSMYSNVRVNTGDQWMFHVSIWDPSLPINGDPSMPHELMYAMHDEL